MTRYTKKTPTTAQPQDASVHLVDIVISVPLTAFGRGSDLKANGTIEAGHWINIDGTCRPEVTIKGLPAGVDVLAVFAGGKLTLRRITARRTVEQATRPVTPRAFI
jgi:hypothetical protein